MTLQYDNYDTAVQEIEERLTQLSLAFTKEEKTTVKLQLQEGKNIVKGKAAIMTYLDQLQGELNTWYYCDC